jgi:UDP-GlcNAc3NAcA epimerase
MPVVMPLHPRTRKMISRCDLSYNFKIVDPLGYFDMLSLLHNCRMVLTDSGGLQKEAFFNKKHCLIARNETEWVELVENDFAAIVGTDPEVIYQNFQKYKNSKADFSKELYGNRVGEAIYEGLKKMVK